MNITAENIIFPEEKTQNKKALTIKGKSDKDGSYYYFEDFTKEEHQLFYFYFDEDDGNYIIVSFYSSKCIATNSKYPVTLPASSHDNMVTTASPFTFPVLYEPLYV